MTGQVGRPRKIMEEPREDMRPPVREDNSRERAAARALELLESGSLDEDGDDKYAVPKEMIPDGWSYEWKRKSVYNQEDPTYQVELKRMGWEPVQLKRHPEMMPFGWKGQTIERDGMMLMERPAEITKRINAKNLQAAREQVGLGEKNLAEAKEGQFERNIKGDSLVRVAKHMEPMEIPED